MFLLDMILHFFGIDDVSAPCCDCGERLPKGADQCSCCDEEWPPNPRGRC